MKTPSLGLIAGDMRLNPERPSPPALSRREFLTRTSLGALAATLPLSAIGAEPSVLPIVVFSKVYQELKLDFDQAAALTSEAGLDGVDAPVRPGGEVLPEKALDELPRYVEALRKQGLQMPLLTTAITSASSPHAEDILRTAKQSGVQYYRLGPVQRQGATPVAKQLAEIKAQLKDLATLNKQIGIGAIFQNHSPSGRTFIGGDLNEMREIVSGFDPAQIGVAFDIGHALVVHGAEWRQHFEQLKSHIKIAYVKDVQREGPRWVPFGQGEIGNTGFFKLLKQTGYHAPLSLHIEFDWDQKGKNRNRATLLQVLRQTREALAGWLSHA